MEVANERLPTNAAPFDLAATPTLGQIAGGFVRYANFTLGGGSATIAVMHLELLEKRHWIDTETFALCFALSRLTPGTNLLAFCTGIGWMLRRLPGAVAALLASSIPCALLVIFATALFRRWQESYWAQAALHGAIAAAVAITVRSCWTILHPHFKGRARPRVAATAVGAFALYVWLSIPPVEVLVLAAVVGAILPPRRT
jgi:chromate transporter